MPHRDQLRPIPEEVPLLLQSASPLAEALHQAEYLHLINALTLDAVVAIADFIEHLAPHRTGHGRRVGLYTRMLAQALGFPLEELPILERGGILHDIGKVGVPSSILLKPGPLDPREWEHMRQHPVTGAEIAGSFRFLEEAVPFILYHHERYDGTGYAKELAGERIPLGSRIIAVADAYDAMTTTRPYRSALDHEDATDEISRGAGTQFDPKVVEAFLKIADEFVALRGC